MQSAVGLKPNVSGPDRGICMSMYLLWASRGDWSLVRPVIVLILMKRYSPSSSMCPSCSASRLRDCRMLKRERKLGWRWV